ncbi:MAG: MBL fold metallo-hydrolase [Gemmatimonadota bacterium]
MKLRFLGTGTSFGIPVVGCTCATCTSPDPRDRRTRHAALLESDDGAAALLVDTPPELRLQLLAAGSPEVSGIWFTHAHADHTAGLDDVRAFTARRRAPLTAWADAACAAALRRRFDYIFAPEGPPTPGTSRPDVRLVEFGAGDVVEAGGFRLEPFAVPHGDLFTWGFRAGALGYVADAKALPDDVVDRLRGVRVLVLAALWEGRPHPTHFNVEEAVAAAARVGAGTTYLTHLTHRVRHAALERSLPPGVAPAHDGLLVDIEEDGI